MEISPLFAQIFTTLEEQPHKPILENSVYNTLQLAIPEDMQSPSNEVVAELLAFRFIEPGRSSEIDPISYFRPLITTVNEAGDRKESPDRSMITGDILKYWIYRAENAKHPILTARYAGLVFDFNKFVTRSNAPFLIAKRYIESQLTAIETDLCKVPVYAIEKARRALDIAISLNNGDLISRAKTAILNLESRIGADENIGLWGFSFDFLLDNNKKLASEQEKNFIISALEERFERSIMIDPRATEAAAERLMKFHFAEGNKEKLSNILANLQLSFEQASNGLSSIQKLHYIEKLYSLSKKFQLNSDAEVYLKVIRELNITANEGFKSVLGESTFSASVLDNLTNQLLDSNNLELIFQRIVDTFTIKIEDSKKELVELSQKNVFAYILSRTIVDNKGRTVATIPPISEDFDAHLVHQYSISMRIGTFLLDRVFKESIKRDILNPRNLLGLLSKSCIIEKDRLIIIEKGIDAYFAGEHITAIHLLIPQFEESIRNLVEMNGGIVLTSKKDVFNLKTFDNLLKDPIVENVFGKDMAFYFRVLFTDNRGWNLRNNVAHGMINSVDLSNKQNIDRLLHALMCLGFIREKEIITNS